MKYMIKKSLTFFVIAVALSSQQLAVRAADSKEVELEVRGMT